MVEDARPEEVRVAQEIVRHTVATAGRLADESGLDATLLLSIAASRLQAFSLGAGATGVPPEDFLKREVRLLRLANLSQ